MVQEVPLKLNVHQKLASVRGESKEEITLHPSAVPGLEAGRIVEISHPELCFARLLMQVSAGSLRDDHKADTVSVDSSVVETFHLRDRLYDTVNVKLVEPGDVALDSVELLFKDHYLNRSDMWRLKNSLVGKVMHHKKSVEFCSQSVRCQVFEMWAQGDRVACGLVTAETKVVFRSGTSMFHLYIQMSEEMWDFDVYGDLYFEKAVNGFLSDLFNNWKRNGTNHEVTITLFSRVFYKAKTLADFPAYMRDHVQQDFRNMFYEDFYRVAVQNERYEDWTPVLSTIRHLFMGYRERLLQFHRHRAPPGAPPPPRAALSSAAQGNFLEVLNISMNVFEKHYLHRSLERTGQMCVVVSPGVGVYQVERQLNNLTKQRIIDYGVGIDLVCVGEQPLHAVPLLKFHNKSLTETQDYYLPHTWINLSFYSSNKRVGYSEFVPRIKVPPGSAPKTAVSRVQSVIPRGRGAPSERAIPSSVYDYDAHDAEVFRLPANANFKPTTMTLMRLPARKRTVTTSVVPKIGRKPSDVALSSPVHEAVYSSSASSFVTPARGSPLVQSPVSPGDQYSSSVGSVPSSDRSDSGGVRRVSYDDSDVTRSPPRPATSAVSACDLSLSRSAVPHGPGRALFNPFDPSNIVVKHTSNRRRWAHIFPKGPKGVLFQQHHYANGMGLDTNAPEPAASSSDTSLGSPSMAFLWGASSTGEQEWSAHITTGVDWKSLTTPACLPITTDYFPDERSLKKDFLLTEYSVLPDDINSPSEAGGAHGPLSVRSVFTEMVSQRLNQGFQLIVPPSKSGSVSSLTAAPTGPMGRAVFPPAMGELREEHLLSIGRIFHRVVLSGSAITVTHYRPRNPHPVRRHSYQYRAQCHHHPSYVICHAELSTDRPEGYTWNYLDNYICTKGGCDFELIPSLKFWRCRFLLVPAAASDAKTLVDNFLKFVSAVTDEAAALNKFKRHQPAAAARPPIRERLSSQRCDQRHRARSGSSVIKVRHESMKESRPPPSVAAAAAAANASNSAEDVSGGTGQIGAGAASTLLSPTAAAAEVAETLRSPELGLPFLTRSVQGGLPEFTFIAADLVQWVYQHVSGLTTEAEAVHYCRHLRKEGVILHASRDPSKAFVNGFSLFCVTNPADGPQLSSACHMEQFFQDWLEVETQYTWPRPSHQVAPFLAEVLSSEDEGDVCQMRRGTLDLDVGGKSERAEWGEVFYEAAYRPDRAYQFGINWLVGTGSIISDLVVSWQRRAQNSGMRLFPVPVLLCSGLQRDIDPLRIPVHVPIALDCLHPPDEPLFDEFHPASRPARLLLLQHAILERFEFVRLRGERPGPPFQFIHTHGHCFVQVPEPELDEEGYIIRAELQWFGNCLLSRRWRVCGDDSADKLISDLSAFCRNQHGRLESFWRQAQARLRQLGRQRPARLPRTPSVGDLVMAPWMGGWYRAEVRSVTDGYPAMLELHYIDYGNDDHHPATDVCFLPQEYKSSPPAAYKCIARDLRRDGESLSPLQRRLLEQLVTESTSRVSAIFHPTHLQEVYQVDLVSELTVGGRCVSADVVATLNNVLDLKPQQEKELCASPEQDVAPLLVEWCPPAPSARPADPAPTSQMPTDEKVRSWLTAQGAQPPQQRPPAKKPPSAPQPAVPTKKAASQPPGSGRVRKPRLREPPQYQGLQVVWSARPLHRLPSSSEPLVVCVLHALAPDHFYLTLGDHDSFDEMQARLQKVYPLLPLHPKQMVSQLLVPGSYWVALRQSDKHYYRCIVLRQPGEPAEDEVAADYPVLWVDFGDEDRVSTAHFRPITEEFATIPLFATRARCAGICAVDGQGRPADRFSSDACQVFRGAMQDRFCRAYPVLTESDPDCLAVTLELEEEGEYLSLTNLLVNASLVGLKYPELAESDSCSVPGSWSAEGGSPRPAPPPQPDNVAEWDPMAEDYVSPYNRVGAEGPDDLGTRCRPDPEDEVCPIYARGGKCWDGIACKRRHVRGGDQQPQQTAVFVEPPEALRLPRVDTTVLVRVTEVRNPASFHVQLLHGATPAEVVSANPTEYLRGAAREETLESLTAAMTAACLARRRLDYSSTCLPAVGELVLAPWENGFHRARVCSLRMDVQSMVVQSMVVHAEVFMVDTGIVMERDVKDLRLMEKQFNLLAFQAVQCCLGFVSPPAAGGWTPRAVQRFVQLVGSVPSLLATVLSRRPDGGLELDLCVNGANGQVRRINQTLIREGLARSRQHRLPEIGAHVPFVPM